VAAELAQLHAENARLLKMLDLNPRQAAPPAPAQAGLFEAPPGPVNSDSTNSAKVAFFHALFAARIDIYAKPFRNQRTGKKGWSPTVRSGWHSRDRRDYLLLTLDVVAAYLRGETHIGVHRFWMGTAAGGLRPISMGRTRLSGR
jgi:hypothetical protein